LLAVSGEFAGEIKSMTKSMLRAAAAAALLVPSGAWAADNAKVDEVKRMIEQMKSEYEERR
jgi:uncharacterized protein YeeX (DUF496 family)